MRVSHLVGKTLRETPRDATLTSHIFLLRGAYVRQVASGIYSLLPIARRITAKIERIIREEMDRIGGQEILMPVVMPRELWEESGRYYSIGDEMVRFKDRSDNDLLLGMTHEEPAVQIVRSEVESYKQLPVMVYQIQTKFRDEPRARGGLIRVREFTMKDAYSFHTSQEDLEEYYSKVHEAYVRIFKRAGLRRVVDVSADTGIMGGGVSHEFMLVTPAGEDTLLLCPHCGYRANKEVAYTNLPEEPEEPKPLEKVATPEQKTIEEVASFLGVPHSKTAKAVFFVHSDKGLVFVLIRGDLEVNETKLRKVLGPGELRPAHDEEIEEAGAVPGYASPVGLDTSKFTLVVDRSVTVVNNLVTGANEEGYHLVGFNVERDLGEVEPADVASVRQGDPCPLCGQPLNMERGIEIGNIFQLGTKYSEPMGCTYLDNDGKKKPMIMGCYGIGVGRLLASVIEESHDDYGPIWPISIAPWQVQICAIDQKKEGVGDTAARLHRELEAAGIEVLWDDRNEKAGVQFADADLRGIPIRLVVSKKTLKNGGVEFSLRGSKDREIWPIDEVLPKVRQTIEKLEAELLP